MTPNSEASGLTDDELLAMALEQVGMEGRFRATNVLRCMRAAIAADREQRPPSTSVVAWVDEVEQRLQHWQVPIGDDDGEHAGLADLIGSETLESLIDAVCAPLQAHPSTTVAAGEARGWLIEHSGKILEEPGPHHVSWLCVQKKAGGFGARELGLTRGATEALRFSRKEDAEAVLAMHLGASPPDWYAKPYSVTEHMWLDPTHPASLTTATAREARTRLPTDSAALGDAMDLMDDACAAATVVAAGEAWQPIETAPKDGRWLFITNRKQLEICYWDDGMRRAYPWRNRGGNGWKKDWPTHWMPPPAAPGTASPTDPKADLLRRMAEFLSSVAGALRDKEATRDGPTWFPGTVYAIALADRADQLLKEARHG